MFSEYAVFVVMLKTISASTATSLITMQAIKKTATMREKFLCITHTNHLNQTTITSEENEYVTKSNHACSVSPSVTKHPQVSRSVTILILHTIAIAVRRAAFGQGTGLVLLSGVRCTGTESSLLSCSHGVAYCSHCFDAGVVCPSCKSYI